MGQRVLVVATSPNSRGGIATVVKAFRETELWNRFNCRWIETHIDKSKLHKLYKFTKALIEYIFLLNRYDIVHIHVSTEVSLKRKYIFYKLAKLCKKKVIIHLHCGTQLSDIWNDKYEDIFINSDICLVLSNSIRDIIVERTGHKDNVRVLYNPCPAIATPQSIEPRKKNILFAATLYKEKGYLDLIDAFAIVYKKHPDWKLLIAGNGSQEEGLSRVKRHSLGDSVVFLGWIKGEEKKIIFSTSSIFCLPSYAEGFPMAVLDAWAYGIPVITTPVGGIPDIVINGENGLLFNPGDVNTLAEQLNMLIENKDLQTILSQKSKSLVSSTFSIECITNQLNDLYSNL